MSPRASDHPLRLARLRRGVSQKWLADETGINRTTLDAIEEGRTKRPTATSLQSIEQALQLPQDFLGPQIATWHAAQAGSTLRLTFRARAVLALRPDQVRQYRSFTAWRQDVSASPTAFASLIGLPRATVANFEGGERSRGFPPTMSAAIMRAFDVSDDYVLALESLPANEDEAARRGPWME